MESPTNYPQLEVLYEDNHLIAVNKQCGDIVQGDKTGDTPLSETVKAFIKRKYDKPGNVFLGVVHRLDRPTSGVIVFAKTSKALTRMNKLFASGATQKIYWAIVQPAPKPEHDTLTHWLVRNPKQNKSYAYPKEVKDSKKAILRYSILKHLKSFTLLEIQLETGRHHQIRAQLAAVGVHIKGDLKYGASRSNPDGGIHLHARHLSFIHPVSQTEINITAPTPSNAIWQACE
ncbi:MAG: RluA family pseudouridine synthase [Bacteroidota bacterium]